MKCIICKKEFVSTVKKQKFCSNSCRQKNYRIETNKLLSKIRSNINSLPSKMEEVSNKVEIPQKKERAVRPPKNNKKEIPNNLNRLEKMRWMRENP